jgi:hypothetical protein
MSRRRRELGRALAAGCLAAVCLSGRAWAQRPATGGAGKGNYFTVKPQGSADYAISGQPAIIAAQVRLAHVRLTTAMNMLADISDPSAVEPARLILYDGYVLLRTATHGIELALSNSKYPNPLLGRRRDKIWEVRLRLVASNGGLENAAKWSDETMLASARTELETAVELLEALMSQMF